jgi:cytochrome b involved in lipid metabolism
MEYCQNKGNYKWVIFEGSVYDTEEYMSNHPGGSDLIEKYLG